MTIGSPTTTCLCKFAIGNVASFDIRGPHHDQRCERYAESIPPAPDDLLSNQPIHDFFGLSYCSYLVLPRSVLQSAPVELQQRLVDVLNELEALFGDVPREGEYRVQLVDASGRFVEDGFRDYERGRRRIQAVVEDDRSFGGDYTRSRYARNAAKGEGA